MSYKLLHRTIGIICLTAVLGACKDNTRIDAAGTTGAALPPMSGNTPPSVTDQSGAGFTTSANAVLTTASVLGGASDADGDTLSLSGFDASSLAGTLTSNGDGTFTYDPGTAFQALTAGQTTTETFSYTVSDGTDTASGTVTLTIVGVNDAPVAVADAASGDENQTVRIDVLANDTDVDVGDTLDITTVQIDTPPDNGAAVPQADGSVLYTPDAEFFGSDRFAYSVADAAGLRSNAAIVSITINEVGALPVAADDAVSTNEDTVLIGDLFADNGSGADGDLDSAFAVSAVNGRADDVGTGIALSSGAVLQVEADGSFSYDPNGQFESLSAGQQQDSFEYTISDGTGADTATVTVTVTGVNDAPEVVTNTGLRLGDADTVFVDDTVLSGADVDHGDPTDLVYDIVDSGRCGIFLDASDAVITQFTQAELEAGNRIRYRERRCNPGQLDTVSLTLTDPAGGQTGLDMNAEIVGFRIVRNTNPAQNSQALPASASLVANVVDSDNAPAILSNATVSPATVASFAGFNGARTARTASATAADAITTAANEDLLAGEWLQTSFTAGIQDATGNALHPFVVRQRAATRAASTGTMTSIQTEAAGRERMAAGDLDGEGDVDLVEHSNALLLRNNGAGNFTVSNLAGFPGSGGRDYIEMADVDGDGDLDLVQLRDRVITVLSNDGTGSFSSVLAPVTIDSPGSSNVFSLLPADLDGDGDIDLAVSLDGGAVARFVGFVVLNDGTGVFGRHPDQANFFAANNEVINEMQMGDLDGDGDLDLATGSNGTGRGAAIFLNAGDGSFFLDSDVPINQGCFRCGAYSVLGDVDGDGDIDLIGAVENDRNGAGSFTAYTSNRVFLNDGDARFAPSPVQAEFGSNGAIGGRMADIDGDGDLDFLSLGAGSSGPVAQRVDVYANDGTGQFARISQFGSSTPGRDALTLADLDGDGDLDAAFGNSNPFGAIIIYQNN